MKKFAMSMAVLLAFANWAMAGSIQVYNSDSKNHTIELKCSGSSKSMEIKGSTTTTYTFHSTSKECDIVGGTVKWPVSKMEDGVKWRIKDGKATKD